MHRTKIALYGLIALAAITSLPALAADIFGDGAIFLGHILATPQQALPPTTTTCTLNAGSTDAVGGCAATATSGVAVTFGKPFNTAPTCVVLDHTTSSGNALATEPTTTTFVLGTTVSGDKITWICIGKQGN